MIIQNKKTSRCKSEDCKKKTEHLTQILLEKLSNLRLNSRSQIKLIAKTSKYTNYIMKQNS